MLMSLIIKVLRKSIFPYSLLHKKLHVSTFLEIDSGTSKYDEKAISWAEKAAHRCLVYLGDLGMFYIYGDNGTCIKTVIPTLVGSNERFQEQNIGIIT